ncbi:MAG: hypothetical protein L6R36_008754 [Xanthoria steineri]|nr:MAG: hypothetical protein L6R36_008754 [Xanthoria steineri]
MAPSFYPRSSVDEPTNKTGLNIRVYCALLVLTTLGLAARVASKRLKRNHFMIDDYLILWAYVLAVAETGILIYGKDPKPLFAMWTRADIDKAIQHAGWGRHLANLHTSEVIAFGKVGSQFAGVFVAALTLLTV